MLYVRTFLMWHFRFHALKMLLLSLWTLVVTSVKLFKLVIVKLSNRVKSLVLLVVCVYTVNTQHFYVMCTCHLRDFSSWLRACPLFI